MFTLGKLLIANTTSWHLIATQQVDIPIDIIPAIVWHNGTVHRKERMCQ